MIAHVWGTDRAGRRVRLPHQPAERGVQRGGRRLSGSWSCTSRCAAWSRAPDGSARALRLGGAAAAADPRRVHASPTGRTRTRPRSTRSRRSRSRRCAGWRCAGARRRAETRRAPVLLLIVSTWPASRSAITCWHCWRARRCSTFLVATLCARARRRIRRERRTEWGEVAVRGGRLGAADRHRARAARADRAGRRSASSRPRRLRRCGGRGRLRRRRARARRSRCHAVPVPLHPLGAASDHQRGGPVHAGRAARGHPPGAVSAAHAVRRSDRGARAGQPGPHARAHRAASSSNYLQYFDWQWASARSARLARCRSSPIACSSALGLRGLLAQQRRTDRAAWWLLLRALPGHRARAGGLHELQARVQRRVRPVARARTTTRCGSGTTSSS